jgi:hypothetical protein
MLMASVLIGQFTPDPLQLDSYLYRAIRANDSYREKKDTFTRLI